MDEAKDTQEKRTEMNSSAYADTGKDADMHLAPGAYNDSDIESDTPLSMAGERTDDPYDANANMDEDEEDYEDEEDDKLDEEDEPYEDDDEEDEDNEDDEDEEYADEDEEDEQYEDEEEEDYQDEEDEHYDDAEGDDTDDVMEEEEEPGDDIAEDDSGYDDSAAGEELSASDADTAAEPDQETHEDEFTELMKDYDLKAAKATSRITGKIIDIINDKVVVDIGQKTEGILNIQELYDWDGSLKHNVGDSITVICKNINLNEGYITVTKKQVDLQDGWIKVKRAFDKKQPVMGRIVGVLEENKGFKVDMGIEMFLPMSQADIKKIKSPKKLLGKEYRFKITRLNSREKNGVVSRRVILEEEKENKVKELFESLKVGDIVKGKVTSLTDYGAFVDIGGMDGLIHKDNISYARVNHPKEKLRKGDEVEARILEMDPANKRISLGIKQRYPDPWVDIEKKYPVGKKLIAKVTKIVSFGAFIELEEGVEGLLHISDLTWEGKTNSVEEFVAVGERLWVQVIELNPEEKKIKLGLKQLEMRPEEKYIQKHKTNETVKGIVKKILKSRVFIELEKGVEGVVKISDITYFRIDSPHEYLKEKETIDVQILSEALDSNYKVKLGIKQLSDPEWREYIDRHKHGSLVPVKIKKATDKGISVEISKNIEGFVRINEIEEKKADVEELKKIYPSGKEIEAMVVSSDYERKRIYLSFRALKRKREREDIDKYSKSSSESVTTIGDLFENAIDRRK